MIKKATWIGALALLLVGSSFAQYTHKVYSELNDAMIEDRLDITVPQFTPDNGSNPISGIGGWYTGLACTVLPFQLPDLGAVSDPYDSASFSAYLEYNGLLNPVDLYFLRTSSSSNIVATNDYYSGTGDTSATLLQSSFISAGQAAGSNVTSDVSANNNLVALLNAAYAGGAGAGDYVFLRLSYTSISLPAGPDDESVSAKINSRNNDDGATWPTISIVSTVDLDSDTLPDIWEINYFGTVAISNIFYIGSSDSDLPLPDGLDNSTELALGTNPSEPDTDGDGLTDGDEVNVYFTDPLDWDTDDDLLSDGLEITNTPYASNPNEADSDFDTVNDAIEFYCGSNPTNAASVPSNTLPEMIGADFFDYTNSSIWSLAGGEFFDIDNTTNNDAYLGHTCDISDWYDTSFNAGDVVKQGLQTTGGNLAQRAFNGLNTGGMTLGVFSTDPTTGSTSSNVYFSVKMTLDGTVDYAGLSFLNGAEERLFFGKTFANGFWGIDGTNNLNFAVTATYGPTNNVAYTIVGKIDLSAENVTLWLDPSIAGGEGGTASIASSALGGFVGPPYTYNALRLASGGSGSVRWDDLVLAYTWDGLDFAGTDSEPDGLRDTWELIWTNDLAVLFSGNDADSDGLNDEVELTLLTDPTKADSDGDGLDDNYEITTNGVDNLYITDPTVADTDGDGLSDGYEVTTNAVDNVYFTNPLDKDTDADTYDDDLEIALGTDPTNPSDSPGGIIIDGSKDGLYGAPVAIQTVETGFGDNLSEWNAAYSYSTNGYLYLLFTGNLQDNGNRLEIFFDSNDDITTNELTTAGNDGTSVMDGTKFDTDFSPEFHITAWRGGSAFNIELADLVITNVSAYTNIFGGSSEGSTTNIGTGPANASPIAVAHDDSNIAGILGTEPQGAAADTNAAVAVETGLELCIKLSDIGSPTGTVKVALMQNGNSPHGYLSNQMFGGLPVGTVNLGGDGDGTWLEGILSGIDLSDDSKFAGDQFFTVSVDAGSAVGPFSITGIQLINGNTDVQLILNGLAIGQDYKIQDSVDLTAGFTDVGSPFTATSETAEVVVLPTDTNAEPERFFQGAVAP